MSDEAEGAPEPKKKGKMMKVIMALVLLAGGAGAAYGLQLAGIIGGAGPAEKEPDVPQLIRKGEADPYAVATEGEEEGEIIAGEGGNEYRTAYFIFTEDFTSNLKDSVGLIQVSIAASTHYDGRVLMWLKKHELAVRSRILIELADTPEEDLLSPEGKERLQQRLTKAINEVLTEAEGFGGVDSVYFRSLLVQ